MSSKQTRYKNKKNKNNEKTNNFKFFPIILQIITTGVLLGYIYKTNLLPDKYQMIAFAGLIALCVITTIMTAVKSKASNVIAIILSIIFTVVNGFALYSLVTAWGVLGNISNATYEVSNMALVVKTDDKAEDITQTEDYTFGVQTFTDTENNNLMIKEIEKVLGKSIEVVEYSNILEEAEALLNGDIDAAIYNEALIPLIEEEIENYDKNVKIIYTYGIEIIKKPVVTPKPDENKEQDKTSSSGETFSVYISGIDTNGKISTTSRSDTNIIMTVNTETKKILLTTTPRDYYVQLVGISGKHYDKLTHSGIYGIDVSVETLENLYDIDIDYYLKVNFTSVINIVNALGGVDVYSKYAFTPRHLPGYYVNEGINTMNGEQALAFARERYAFTEGDNQRGKNQQEVIIGMLNKIMSPSVVTALPEIIASVQDNFQTNMSDTKIAELLKMQLNDGAAWEIETISATGFDSSDSCYAMGGLKKYVMKPDYDSVDAIKVKMQEVLEK